MSLVVFFGINMKIELGNISASAKLVELMCMYREHSLGLGLTHERPEAPPNIGWLSMHV